MEQSRKKFLRNIFIGAGTVPVPAVVQAPAVREAALLPLLKPTGPTRCMPAGGSAIQRTNITDGKTGTPLNITLTVVNTNSSCAVLSNARVDIWHCDKDGYYSGYSNSGYLGTQDNSALVFCRGLQYSDSSGQVKFTSVYPGWYTGRVTHIHVQVYVNSVLKLTTQIAFPDSVNTTVYNTSLYSAHGRTVPWQRTPPTRYSAIH